MSLEEKCRYLLLLALGGASELYRAPTSILSLWPLTNEVVAASHTEIAWKEFPDWDILLSDKLFDLFMCDESRLWN